MRFGILVGGVLLLAGATTLVACDYDNPSDTEDVNASDIVHDLTDVAVELLADDNYPCTRNVEAVLTFWDVTCWGGGIFCDGVQVTVEGREEGVSVGICDIGPESCEEPGVRTFDYTFEYLGGDCEYCSGSDDIDICVPLDDTCDKQVVEVTASGSEEGGVHPMTCCPDDPDCV